MISVDPADVNKKFAEQELADFPILSDPEKKVADAYGVLSAARTNAAGEAVPQMARRWTFYIGGDGKILAIDRGVKPASAGEDLTAKLQEINAPKKK